MDRRPPLVRSLHLRGQRTPLIVAGVCLLLTLMVALSAYVSAEARRRERFEQLADQAVATIDSRLETYVALLRGGAGLFSASDTVRPDEFSEYVERIDLQRRYPGVQGVGYAVWLGEGAPAGARAFAAEALPPGVRPWPSDGQAQSAIVYLQPLDRRNLAALGYDMYSEPTRQAAMARARDEGAPAASARVTLVQEIDPEKQPGFLIYLPIYAHGTYPATVQERRRRIVGWIYAPFRAHNLFEQTFAGSDLLREAQLEVIDGASGGPVLFRSGPDPQRPGFTLVRTVDAAGRPWTVRLRARTPAALPPAWLPPALVLLAGLLVTVAFTWATWLQNRSLTRARAAEAEARREHELAEFLRNEANHRVANSLQLVASLVGLQVDSVKEPAARQALADTRTRILAVGRVHQRLYRSGRVDRVELCGYLENLVSELAQSLDGAAARLRMTRCSAADLSPDKAIAVGVAVAELVTNAVKYAYPPDAPGEIEVSVRREGDRLTVAVEDSGVGFDPAAPSKGTGLGMKVVRAMGATLAAEVSVEDRAPGTRVALAFAAG